MPTWEPIDLALRLPDDGALRDLLLPVIWAPSDAKVGAILARYGCDPGWALLGYESDGLAIGCIGIAIGSHGEAIIEHIAVVADRRRQGIGSSLIRDAVKTLRISSLTAETDADAVLFYRRCGFETQSLGEVYPGVERFLCRLRPA